MSTIKVVNIQHVDATEPGLVLGVDGSVSIPALDLPLEDISDVEVDHPADGEALVYQGGLWVNGAVGGGLEGSSYVFVAGDGTQAENGSALRSAYEVAKTMEPYGNALSSSNRVVVLVAPGIYDLGADDLTLDEGFVDVMSLDGERSVIIKRSGGSAGAVRVRLTSDGIRLRGIDAEDGQIRMVGGTPTSIFEKCRATGAGSFSSTGLFTSGTFIDCVGGANAFGGATDFSGTAIRCVGTTGCFTGGAGGGFIFSGVAEDTTITSGFGEDFSSANGTMLRCTVTGSSGFGPTGSGSILYCRLLAGSFPTSSFKIRLSLEGISLTEVNRG
jgi:hypothetical protein